MFCPLNVIHRLFRSIHSLCRLLSSHNTPSHCRLERFIQHAVYDESHPYRTPRLLPPTFLDHANQSSWLEALARATKAPQRRPGDLRKAPRAIHRRLQHTSIHFFSHRYLATDQESCGGREWERPRARTIAPGQRYARTTEGARESLCPG